MTMRMLLRQCSNFGLYSMSVIILTRRDLAPYDFFCFPKMKSQLWGYGF